MPHSTLPLRWIAMGLSLLASAPAIAQPGQPSVAPAKPAAPDPATGLDRAVAALDRLAGADTDAIFAVPTAAQRETVARLAGPALADADAHQAWAVAEARRLMALIQDESVPEADRNAVGPRLNELREAVLGARLPVVRGRLLAALAGAETDAARRAQRARDAVAALENG
ncbi:MAG: hypothetical protein KIT68_13360, partial [Phycisphaeraceae bacterium]|nr:hypothetical protein [Phycisphaeraceae bacterium]